MSLIKLGHGAYASGSVLQVQRTRLTSLNTQALTQNTMTAITGLSVNITPKFSNSLIRLDGHFFGELGHEDNTFNHTIAFMRDSTGLHEFIFEYEKVGLLIVRFSIAVLSHPFAPVVKYE